MAWLSIKSIIGPLKAWRPVIWEQVSLSGMFLLFLSPCRLCLSMNIIVTSKCIWFWNEIMSLRILELLYVCGFQLVHVTVWHISNKSGVVLELLKSFFVINKYFSFIRMLTVPGKMPGDGFLVVIPSMCVFISYIIRYITLSPHREVVPFIPH